MQYIKEYIKNQNRVEFALKYILKKIEPILTKKDSTFYTTDMVYNVYSTTGDKFYMKIEIDFNRNDENYSNRFFASTEGLLYIKKLVNRYRDKFLKEDIIISIEKEYRVLKNTIILIAKDISGKRVYPPKYVYHITKNENVNDILKNGLIPKDNTIIKNINDKPVKDYKWSGYLQYPSAVFVTTDTTADIFSRVNFGDTIIKINTNKCNNKFFYDLNQEVDQEKNWLMTFDPIPANAIEDTYLKENVEFNHSDIFNQIDIFLKSDIRNIWVQNDSMKIYIRKSKRYVNNEIFDFFDIASVEVNEEYQGNGFFTYFIKTFLNKYTDKNVYVESIINPAIEHILKKFNFKYLTNTEYNVNMYKMSEK